MLDRILQHSHVLNLKGKSYRMRSKVEGANVKRHKGSLQVGPP